MAHDSDQHRNVFRTFLSALTNIQQLFLQFSTVVCILILNNNKRRMGMFVACRTNLNRKRALKILFPFMNPYETVFVQPPLRR